MVPQELRPTKRVAPGREEQPTAVFGGVTQDARTIQHSVPEADVHPPSSIGGGVADDLSPDHRHVTTPCVHATAFPGRERASDDVAADDRVDQRQIGVVAIDPTTETGDVAVDDRHARDNGRACAGMDFQHPVRDDAAGIDDRLIGTSPDDGQGVGDVQVTGGVGILAVSDQGQHVGPGPQGDRVVAAAG